MKSKRILWVAAVPAIMGCFSPTDTEMDTGLEMSTGATMTPMETTETEEDDEDIEFVDSFEQDLGAWTFRDDVGAIEEGPGQWAYIAGDLVQRADISGPEAAIPSLGTNAIGGDPDWDAYIVEVAFTADDDGVAGVLCHDSGAGDFVRLELDHETGLVRLVRSEKGALTVLAESAAFSPPVELGVERTLTLECGATYRGFVDGVHHVEGGTGTGAEGAVGLYASSIGDGPVGLRFHFIEVSDD